jgi:hypothetical protein
MGTWDRIKAALRREKQELDQTIRDAESRGDAAMTKKEQDLTASPEEKLRLEQERGTANDAEFDAVRKRIEGDG